MKQKYIAKLERNAYKIPNDSVGAVDSTLILKFWPLAQWLPMV